MIIKSPSIAGKKNMGRAPKYSLEFQQFASASRIKNCSNSISQWLTDLRLPQELIIEILLRLPVKSLLKFKCVSKSWLSLISSPQFIKSHLSTSSREGEYLNHQLLFNSRICGIKQCSLYSALHEPSTHVSEIEYPSQSPDYPPWIVGVVNGLICLAIKAIDLFLWNPALRKFKHLRSSNVSLEPSVRSINYGFGYDESNDDYKVVCLLSVYVSASVCVTEVKIYSLRADSWRRIEDPKGILKGFIHMYYNAMYANGKMYWAAFKTGNLTRIRKVVSLDMVSETYGELQQPDYEAGDCRWKFCVVGGQPSMLCDYYRKKTDLWVMDGVQESWCKVVSIPYDDVRPLMRHSLQQVHCILSNGEIVVDNGYFLLVYHSKKKEFRNIELGAGSSTYYEVPAYVESLVSPNGSSV